MVTEPKRETSRTVAPVWRALGILAGALGGAVAALLAAVLAVVCAVALLLLALVAAVVVAIRAVIDGAGRLVRQGRSEPDLLEARHVGGHSWVAYGWDGRR